MFYYLSKIFWFFGQPINLAIFLLLAGLLAALFGRRRPAGTGSLLGIAILVLSAWTSVGAMMLNPLEERFLQRDLRATEPRLHDVLRDAQRLGDINGAHAFHFPEHEDRSIDLRQRIERRFDEARHLAGLRPTLGLEFDRLRRRHLFSR